jgi:hypothetical protein
MSTVFCRAASPPRRSAEVILSRIYRSDAGANGRLKTLMWWCKRYFSIKVSVQKRNVKSTHPRSDMT